MPLFTFHQQNLAANATFLPLTGWQFEYLPFPALVEMAFDASAIGVEVTVTSGSDTLAESQPISGGGTDGTFPDFDKPMLEDIAAAGDRLKMRFLETAGAATNDVQGWVRITPLG